MIKVFLDDAPVNPGFDIIIDILTSQETVEDALVQIFLLNKALTPMFSDISYMNIPDIDINNIECMYLDNIRMYICE